MLRKVRYNSFYVPASTDTTMIGSMSELSLSDWFDNRYEISRSSDSSEGYITDAKRQLPTVSIDIVAADIA